VPGSYHRVEKGQTLWRIAKTYGADMQEVVEINKISDASSIEVGQMIFIPRGSSAPKEPVVIQAQSPANARIFADEDFVWPLRGSVISTFGQSYEGFINNGIFIQPSGDGSVVASRSGTVSFYSPQLGSFGKTLIIDHGDGFSTVYARNEEVYVKPGDVVRQRTMIAKAGKAGKDRRRYLYFEIRKGYTAQNPNFYLAR
jgi:murein DD-endopeptidase MepM/ murein hydrolase activator NlpD